MAKYFIDVVQDSSRTSLGIPVKTITPTLGPYCRSWNRLSVLNFTCSWSPALSRFANFPSCVHQNTDTAIQLASRIIYLLAHSAAATPYAHREP